MKKILTGLAAIPLIAGWLQLEATPATAAMIEKVFENTVGAHNSNPIPMKQTQTTTYALRITYTSQGSGAVTILDTIPAEFVNVAVTGASCLVEKKGIALAGATSIRCDLPPSTDAVLIVTFETRLSPGKGHKTPVYAPTSCEPLVLNEGAFAVDSFDPSTVVAGPSAGLFVNVTGDECTGEGGEGGEGEIGSLQTQPAPNQGGNRAPRGLPRF